MKAIELMIGDWVLYMDTKPCQIVAIDSTAMCRIRTLLSDKMDEFGNKDYKAITSRLEDLSPIPLTPEILEKNANGGFGNYDCGSRATYHIHQGKESVAVYVEWQRIYPEPYIELMGLGDTTYKGYCASVHKLQHALRLCGLDELADNFKI